MVEAGGAIELGAQVGFVRRDDGQPGGSIRGKSAVGLRSPRDLPQRAGRRRLTSFAAPRG